MQLKIEGLVFFLNDDSSPVYLIDAVTQARNFEEILFIHLFILSLVPIEFTSCVSLTYQLLSISIIHPSPGYILHSANRRGYRNTILIMSLVPIISNQ